MFKIAILGSNSHIAKTLIYNFIKKNNNIFLFLFTTREEILRRFLSKHNLYSKKVNIISNYNKFHNEKYDVIINCIGIGTIFKIKDNYFKYFSVLEKFDSLIIDYLQKVNNNSLYISIGSGAIYTGKFLAPANKNSKFCVKVNQILKSDYYSIVRLYLEAKHRAYNNLNIVDIRIFSFFSRFIDLKNDKYFITELINCVKEKKLFLTDNTNIIRDYLHHEDLFTFLIKLIEKRNINSAFDLLSKKPVKKFDIIKFFSKEFGLRYKIVNNFKFNSATGIKKFYYSTFKNYKDLDFYPKFSSFETIKKEINFLF